MPSHLNYEVDRKYLSVAISANGDTRYALQESRRIWQQFNHLSRRENRPRILATIEVASDLPVKLSVDIARLALESGLRKDVKIAFYLPSPQNRLTFGLVKTFMVHLGFQAETFTQKNRARKWLLQPTKKTADSAA